jgi:putative ABC transport system permease protein
MRDTMRDILSPRWKKLLRDIGMAPGRIAMIVVAIAVGVYGVAAMSTAYSILTREISRNYLDTNPASASIELDALDDALLDAVRHRPDIALAEGRTTIGARIEVKPNTWLPLKLFVVSDFNAMRLSTFKPESGAWPPPHGSLLLEREALTLIGAKIGDRIPVKTRGGGKHEATIAGTVHDPSLAPAWQEQVVYAYATPETIAALGDHAAMRTLKVLVKDRPYDAAAVDATIASLATWLKQQGRTVEEIHVPPPGMHPHQSQMTAVVRMLLMFSVMALLLGAVLTATMIGGMLAQQSRQIGVMKAIGARRGQIASMYLVLVAVLGVVATCIGVPLGGMAGRVLADAAAHNLNFTLYSDAVPAWATLLQIAAGIVIPLAVASFSILRFTRITVREAIANTPAQGSFGLRRVEAFVTTLRAGNRMLSFGLRNAFRRPARLLLTLALLSAGGAMFIGSLNLKAAWGRVGIEAAEHRHYDLEIFLQEPEMQSRVVDIIGHIGGLGGVVRVESWAGAAASALRSDGVAIDRVYPDGGHGSLALREIPEGSNLIDPPLMSGRRLQPGEEGGAVLTHNAQQLLGDVQPGDTLALSVRGRPMQLKVAGVVRQFMTSPTVYVSPATLDRTLNAAGLSRTYRVVLDAHTPEAINAAAARIERALEQNNIGTAGVVTEMMLADAGGGHLRILIVVLVVISLLMGTVGVLGLMSAMGANVAERTREFGVMRAVGATSGMVRYTVLAEGLFIGLMGGIAGIVLALPLSMALGRYLGRLSFGLPLPAAVSASAIAIWIALVVAGAILASVFPARRAARLTIRETLSYT